MFSNVVKTRIHGVKGKLIFCTIHNVYCVSFCHCVYISFTYFTGSSQISRTTCDLCGKYFASVGNMERHRISHTGQKPYSCHMCDKSFNQKANLKSHLSLHSGEKPFKCDICQKSFRMKGNLNSHLVTHMDNVLLQDKLQDNI